LIVYLIGCCFINSFNQPGYHALSTDDIEFIEQIHSSLSSALSNINKYSFSAATDIIQSVKDLAEKGFRFMNAQGGDEMYIYLYTANPIHFHFVLFILSITK
jgi:hypothetical protein